MTAPHAQRVEVEVGSPEWHDARRDGITASEVAPMLGIAPPGWGSPYALYMRKRRTVPEPVDTEAMQWGRDLEAVILARFARAHPELRVTAGALYRVSSRPWQMATPDGLAYYGPSDEPAAVVQVKTDASAEGWGDEGTDEIPIHYRAQVLWEMDVMRAPVAYLPVLFGGRNYREYVVEYDPADVAFIRQRAGEFLDRLERDDPPPLDWTKATTRTLRALHPSVVDTDAEVPADAVELYRACRAVEVAAGRGKALAENMIRAALGDAARGFADGDRVVSRTVYDRGHVNSKRLRTERPDVWAEYETTTTVDRLNVSRQTKGATI